MHVRAGAIFFSNMSAKGCQNGSGFNKPTTMKLFWHRKYEGRYRGFAIVPAWFLAQCVGENQCKGQTLSYFVFEWHSMWYINGKVVPVHRMKVRVWVSGSWYNACTICKVIIVQVSFLCLSVISSTRPCSFLLPLKMCESTRNIITIFMLIIFKL